MIASLTLELRIEAAQSLKDKRQVVRSMKDRLRASFNVSVAELDPSNLWNQATIGVVAISHSRDYLDGLMKTWSAQPRASPITTGRRLRIRLWSFYEILPRRSDKNVNGLKRGMSAGTIAAQNRGFALSATAVASIAATKVIRIIILIAHVRSGNTCI